MSTDVDFNKERKKFDLLYGEIRNIIIQFQLESPIGPVYASGFNEIIRNAHDDCITGYADKDIGKMANAMEHLVVAGAEALELILLDKMYVIRDIYREINFILWRRLYPQEIFEYLHKNMEYIKNKLIQGKIYKSTDFHKARSEFENGIKCANKVIENFFMKKLPGLHTAEKRISYFVTFGLGLVSGIAAGFLIGLIF